MSALSYWWATLPPSTLFAVGFFTGTALARVVDLLVERRK